MNAVKQTKVVYTCSFETELSYREQLLMTGRDADCEFLVGSPAKLIKGHHLILESCSIHFAGLFKSSTSPDPIRVEHISPKVFMMMLKGIYTYHIEISDLGFALALAKAAAEFKLQSIYSHCINFMSNSKGINEETVISLLEIEMGSSKDLRDDCWSFISNNTRAVLESHAFLNAKPATVAKIFAREDLKIASELDLVDALWRYACINEALPVYSRGGPCNQPRFDKMILPALCHIRLLAMSVTDVFKSRSVQDLVPPTVLTGLGAYNFCPEQSFYSHHYPEHFSQNPNPRNSGSDSFNTSVRTNIISKGEILSTSTPNQSALANGNGNYPKNGSVTAPPEQNCTIWTEDEAPV